MFKKYLPTSLFGRTFLIVMVPVLLLQIFASIVFFDRHWSKMTERLAYAVSGEIVAVVNELNNNPNNEMKIASMLQTYLDMDVFLDVGVTEFPIMNKDPMIKGGRSFFSNWNFQSEIEKSLSNEIRKMTDASFRVRAVPSDKNVIVYFLTPDGLIRFNIAERRLFSSSSYIFILWMIGLSLLLFTVAMIFMRNQIRPIYRLGIIAERLGRGIPVGKIKPSGAREVRQTAEAFSIMQERINQFIVGRTAMLAGVSHDLRTPLTRMKLQLEMMDDGTGKDALRNDINDMEHMIEGYLSFAKGDGGEDMQRVNLKTIIDKVEDDAKRLSLDVQCELDIYSERMIWVKPIALARAFDNFIANASRYASAIYIQCSDKCDVIAIHIHDNGKGIVDDKIDEMMKPFVRGEASRNLKTGGVGLGLTIANDIINAHGGVLKLTQSDKLGGLLVSIELPL